MKYFIILSLLFAGAISKDSCDEPSFLLNSIIGEKITHHTKNLINDEMQTCLKVELPRLFSIISSQCFNKVTKFSWRTLNNRNSFILPDSKGYVELYKKLAECKLQSLNVHFFINELDSDAYLEAILSETWSYSPQTDAIFHGIMGKCVNLNMRGDKLAYIQMFETERCITEEMYKNCDYVGKGAGLTLLALKAFYTLMEEPKCNGFKVPSNLTSDIFAQCLKEANKEWHKSSEQTYYTGSMLNHDTKEKIEVAFNFFRSWGKNILKKTIECSTEKVGIYTPGKGINYVNSIKLINSLGWKDIQSREKVVKAAEDCKVTSMKDSELEQMGGFLSNEFKGNADVVLERFQFEKCFGPKYVDICGLNNDVSKIFYPLLNNDINNLVIEDFKEKKGFTAVLHMSTIFRGLFVDFITNLI